MKRFVSGKFYNYDTPTYIYTKTVGHSVFLFAENATHKSAIAVVSGTTGKLCLPPISDNVAESLGLSLNGGTIQVEFDEWKQVTSE